MQQNVLLNRQHQDDKHKLEIKLKQANEEINKAMEEKRRAEDSVKKDIQLLQKHENQTNELLKLKAEQQEIVRQKKALEADLENRKQRGETIRCFNFFPVGIHVK